MTVPYLVASYMVDAVASNSRFVLERHKKLGYFAKIPDRVIFNIADPSDGISPSTPADSDLVFGFIGRIEPEKGIDVVLKAVDLLPDSGWRLKIAGKGAQQYVNELKARHTGSRVEWLGFAKPRDFYASIDVCLISSVWPEPLPRTLIESIGAGRATICSSAGGIPEISGFSNMIGSYDPIDHRKLADLMIQAVGEKSRWKVPQPIRPDFAENFTPHAITQKYLEIYSSPGPTAH